MISDKAVADLGGFQLKPPFAVALAMNIITSQVHCE